MALRILGTGTAVPENIVHNTDLEKIMETSDEWIRTRTGIVTRHISKDKDTADLALEAARKAIAEADDAEKEKIDLIVVATASADSIMPSVSSLVHHHLGFKEEDFVAIDINMACTGFIGALKIAESMLKVGRNALVIGADVLSKITNFEDRSTAILFGDAAGAFLVQKKEGEFPFYSAVREDYEFLKMDGFKVEGEPEMFIHMNGREVYRFAVNQVPEAMEKLAERYNINFEDVDHFVLHQANTRILEQVARRVKIDIEKFPMILDKYGNTSASSIPLAIEDMREKGTLKSGDKLMMASFGAGLQYNSCLLEWSDI